LIGQIAGAYDYVIIDAPPMLGLADSPLLAQIVDGVVFVVEADGVPVRGIRTALDRLRGGKAHLLGVILTKLKKQQAAYGYGYGYGDRYGAEAHADTTVD
jgi:Mrp family chromosome partitioning ATPase